MNTKLYFNTVQECNEKFDELKMQGNYESIIELVTINREMLLSDSWNVNKIIQDCKTIIELHEKL